MYFHDPKTGKTVEAQNETEAVYKLNVEKFKGITPKVTPKTAATTSKARTSQF